MLNHPDQLDQMFHALGDANRRAMIDSLSRSDMSVTELNAPLRISMPATLQHLSILEEAGLVKTRKLGRVRTCTLDTSALSKAEQWINQRRAFWNNRLDALGDFLKTTGSDMEQGDKK